MGACRRRVRTADMIERRDARFWHKADIPTAPIIVRYWELADVTPAPAAVDKPAPTRLIGASCAAPPSPSSLLR